MKTSFKTFAAAFSTRAQNSSESRDASARIDESRYLETQSDKDKRNMQRNDTHARYDAALASISDEAKKVAHQLDLDVSRIVAMSREAKKRLMLMLDAIARNSRVNDRAIDALMQYLVAKDSHSFTLREFQREAQHETTTQAQYARTMFVQLCDATLSESKSRVTLDASADTIYSRLRAIYARSDASADAARDATEASVDA